VPLTRSASCKTMMAFASHTRFTDSAFLLRIDSHP
jgi:hypothetical protein